MNQNKAWVDQNGIIIYYVKCNQWPSYSSMVD